MWIYIYESCCIIGDDFYFVMNIIYLIGLMWSNKFEKIKSCRGLAHFNSALTLALSFQLTAHVRVPCLWFLYPMLLFKYFKRVDIFASLPDPKGQRIMVVVCIMTTLQHFVNVTLPNILVGVVCPDHQVYSNNDSTLDSASHIIVHDDFTRS